MLKPNIKDKFKKLLSFILILLLISSLLISFFYVIYHLFMYYHIPKIGTLSNLLDFQVWFRAINERTSGIASYPEFTIPEDFL